MASANAVNQIKAGIADLEKIDYEKILRKNLGDESLEKDFSDRLERILKLVSFVKTYADQVHDEPLNGMRSVLKNIFDQLTAQAGRGSSDFIAQRQAFLTSIDAQLEESRKWSQSFVSAAVLERGFLEDEGIRREYERTLESMKSETASILAQVKKEAETAVAGAKELAEQIEARARRTATGISIRDAQNQFGAAVNTLGKKVHFWGWWVAGSIVLVVLVTSAFMLWPLPEKAEWPVHIYHTILRVLVLSAIAGFATLCVRLFRVHLHLKEMNEHRVRVANSAEGFVNSATDPGQRDLILAKIMESIVHHGDSGFIRHEKEEQSSTMSADVIGRILSAIVPKK